MVQQHKIEMNFSSLISIIFQFILGFSYSKV